MDWADIGAMAETIAEQRQIVLILLLDPICLIDGDYTTCTAMLLSGVWIGAVKLTLMGSVNIGLLKEALGQVRLDNAELNQEGLLVPM